ncbi:PASTA domain-containing protein [Williamsia sterculiae]|uniref:PASTA domain-containing protein n=2 Tax=Williamsia sterculiae TaxID=1344003 RepID=A0A1N7GGP1_9NOCA|nr:PASTA domain-containing protein [Williamsia sterculiae]
MLVVIGFLVFVLLGVAGCADGTDTDADDAERSEKMPKVVGMKLDEAKDALSDKGFKNVDSEDAAADRSIIVESNWVVVRQSIAADQTESTKTKIKLGAAKPSDKTYKQLLAEGQGAKPGPSSVASATSTPPPAPAKPADTSDADLKHNPCRILALSNLDTSVFIDSFQEPNNTVDTEKDGFRQASLGCANTDLSLSIEVTKWRSPQEASKTATDDAYPASSPVLVGQSGISENYPTGGGTRINPTSGVSRQTFAVGPWEVLTTGNFDDSAIVQVKRKEDPVPVVISTFDKIKKQATAMITSGDW